jgi:hypothetical protein
MESPSGMQIEFASTEKPQQRPQLNKDQHSLFIPPVETRQFCGCSQLRVNFHSIRFIENQFNYSIARERRIEWNW